MLLFFIPSLAYHSVILAARLNEHKEEVDPPGFEPGASALQGRRSPSLSYGPT